jgi:hypothetical protein
MSKLFHDEASFKDAGAAPGQRDPHDACRVHTFAATTADVAKGIPSGEIPVGIVVQGPRYSRELAIEWVYVPASRRGAA